MWKSVLFLVPAVLSAAAILPENVGPYHKTGSKAPVLLDRPVWDEYGLQDSEDASYEAAGKPPLHVLAYRLQDATGGLAAFQWQRPAAARPATDPKLLNLTRFVAQTATGETVALGNHLLVFEGFKPDAEELAVVFRSLPLQQSGPLPTLPNYLPDAGLQPNSERYITGPAGLSLFAPGVSASAAAFRLGTEAQLGAFNGQKLAIFSFPTPDSARDQAAQLQKTPGVLVKRTGPLVAVVLASSNPDQAERLLSQVRYQASVTVGEKSLPKKENVGSFMLNIFLLIGILLVFCLLSGLVFGGVRTLFRRAGPSGDGDAMISLHLSDQ